VITKTQAELVLAAVTRKFSPYVEPGFGPTLLSDFDGRPWTIVWEEGPYEWPFAQLDAKTVDEELTAEAAEYGAGLIFSPAVTLPPGVWVEPVNHYSIAVYPK